MICQKVEQSRLIILTLVKMTDEICTRGFSQEHWDESTT